VISSCVLATRRLHILIFYVSDISRFLFPLDSCTGRIGPEGGTYFPFERRDCTCATPARCHAQMARLSNVFDWIALPPSAPRVPRTHSSGCPAGLLFFSFFFGTRNFGLIDQIINAIEFLTGEEDVDVADETLGWE
jgi:hypothetical protein